MQATETRSTAEHLMWEAHPQYSREQVIIASGQGKLMPGTVLGMITASGKYVASPDTGADGSQVAVAVLYAEVDATGADAPAVIHRRSAVVNANVLAFAASVNDAAKRAAKITQLAAAGIIAR